MKTRVLKAICLGLIILTGITVTMIINSNKDLGQKLNFDTVFDAKINQWNETLGYVDRNIPTKISSENLNSRYPTYGTSLLDITDEEKDNILQENSIIMASSTSYDSIDKDGKLLLNGVDTGKTLYKHISSVGMYYGDVLDTEKAVVEKITISATEQRNFVTGLYAPAGEIVKIEISQDDLNSIGGSLLVCIGQVSHRNNVNNIWKARNDFSRMPIVANKLTINSTTAYVGSPLGGPIYIYPASFGNTFSVTISGAVKYAHYIHGKTTKQECEQMSSFSAPYFDFEIWDLGVRLSGSNKYANYDYDNLVKVGNLWEKIIRTSRQVPCSANATIGVGYVYDCFVAAGSACAFQGGHSWINAPCNWMQEALNYNSMVENGFWGTIHEYNHLYQSYGMENTKTNEVTNNATSLLSYVLYTKISQKRSTDDASLGGGWNRYTDPSRSLRETIANANNNQTQNSLNAYADLIHTFGVDVYTKATRLQKTFGVDYWYEALSLATQYNFTYYFEKILGQTLSDEKKSLYDTADRILFVPIATVFQTGRDFYANSQQVFTKTVMPYRIERGTNCEIDFNTKLILPSDWSFSIKQISSPKNGNITKLKDNVYQYTPGKNNLSGTIKVVVQLKNNNYITKDVTLTLEFEQYDKNQVDVTRYSFDGDTSYTSVDEAIANNFAGYTSVEKTKNNSTFINKLVNKQIGVVEGKIYISQTGNYAVCLRSGRGNNTLYLSVNSKNNLQQVLSLNTDHPYFAVDGEHVIKLQLNKGDYLYFKEITLSRHYADAYTELGIANLDNNSNMASVPTQILCTNDMQMPSKEFSSQEKYRRTYSVNQVLNSTSNKHKLVSCNMPSWDETTKIENIFDDNQNNFYHNAQGKFVSESNPFELIVDIGKAETFNSIKITSRDSGQYNLPSTFSLFGSHDCKKWFLAGKFDNLSLNGNSVNANFDDCQFRFYKLVVTDTKSATDGNKYVTIKSIELSFNFDGIEKSPVALDFYKQAKTNFDKVDTIGSFGYLIKGNGIITYSFVGTKFALISRQDNDCKLRVTVDKKVFEYNLTKSGKKEIAFSFGNLSNKKHDIKIEVLSGFVCVDSIIQK